jgi:hypothetical protein
VTLPAAPMAMGTVTSAPTASPREIRARMGHEASRAPGRTRFTRAVATLGGPGGRGKA